MFEKERFMFKQILASIAVATIAMVSPASSQQSPPTSEQAKRAALRLLRGRKPRQGGLLRIYKAR